jgi:hypothetical protein
LVEPGEDDDVDVVTVVAELEAEVEGAVEVTVVFVDELCDGNGKTGPR